MFSSTEQTGHKLSGKWRMSQVGERKSQRKRKCANACTFFLCQPQNETFCLVGICESASAAAAPASVPTCLLDSGFRTVKANDASARHVRDKNPVHATRPKGPQKSTWKWINILHVGEKFFGSWNVTRISAHSAKVRPHPATSCCAVRARIFPFVCLLLQLLLPLSKRAANT